MPLDYWAVRDQIRDAVEDLESDCTGFVGEAFNWLSEQATGNDYQSQCEHLTEQARRFLEVMDAEIFDAAAGYAPAQASFARAGQSVVPLLTDHLADPSVLENFFNEVVKPTVKTAATVAAAAGGLGGLLAIPVGLLLLRR